MTVWAWQDDETIRVISARRASAGERRQYEHEVSEMKDEYDFSKAKQSAVIPTPGKVQISIRLDRDLIDWFKQRVINAGGGSYQSMINDALREHIHHIENGTELEATLRRVVREELERREQAA